MSNKIIIALVVLIVVVGGILLLVTGQKKSSSEMTSSNPSQQTNPANSPQNQQNATVTLTNSGFDPATLTVKPGTRVIWVNKMGEAATVNSAEYPNNLAYPPLNLGEFNTGSSVQLVFDKPGTYKYYDYKHRTNTGVIIVK